jgi:hAT family C-terminal dimerisation region
VINFPVLAHIAHNILAILAIPGASISVEHLFSSSEQTLSYSHSLLTAESVSKTVVAKELLKNSFSKGLNYL